MNRRGFVKFLSMTGIGLWASSFFKVQELMAAIPTKNLPPNTTPYPETDPVASAIGFKHNIADLDKTKYANRFKKEGKTQFCGGCALFTSTNKEWGKCQMLTIVPNGVVSSKGWCASWSKKA